MLATLLLAIAQVPPTQDPLAGEKIVNSVERYMRSFGVKEPLRLESLGNIGPLLGNGQDRWEVNIVSGKSDNYYAFVGSDGFPIVIERGFEGWDQRDLPDVDQLPINSPMFTNFADHILAQIPKTFELGPPSMWITHNNLATVSSAFLHHDREYVSPSGEGAGFFVTFRPDLGIMTEYHTLGSLLPVNAEQPTITLDQAKESAQTTLDKTVVPEQKNNGWFDVTKSTLTGASSLAYYYTWGYEHAVLAWLVEYKVTFKERLHKSSMPGIYILGGPINTPLQACIAIDATNGNVLDTKISALSKTEFSRATTKVGKYQVLDDSNMTVHTSDGPDGYKSLEQQRFEEIKNGAPIGDDYLEIAKKYLKDKGVGDDLHLMGLLRMMSSPEQPYEWTIGFRTTHGESYRVDVNPKTMQVDYYGHDPS